VTSRAPALQGPFGITSARDTEFPFCTSVITHCKEPHSNLLPHSRLAKKPQPRHSLRAGNKGCLETAAGLLFLSGCGNENSGYLFPLKQNNRFHSQDITASTQPHCVGPRSAGGRAPQTDILSLRIFLSSHYTPWE